MVEKHSWMVSCGKHGKGPGYAICLHVSLGDRATHIVRGTEKELGEALCAACQGKKDLTADDLMLCCAGCFAELQELAK